jgi:ribonuclease HI
MGQQRMDGFEPGDAGEFLIVFDGGSKGNPGRGYGSYKIFGPTGELAHRELTYGDRDTNNQAEYWTLINALIWLKELLGERAASATVVVNGDSLLVINQLLGSWKVKNVGLQPLHRQASDLLKSFGKRKLTWHDRSNSVRILGH